MVKLIQNIKLIDFWESYKDGILSNIVDVNSTHLTQKLIDVRPYFIVCLDDYLIPHCFIHSVNERFKIEIKEYRVKIDGHYFGPIHKINLEDYFVEVRSKSGISVNHQ